jgi:hypothetical protein
MDGDSARDEWVEHLYEDIVELHRALQLDILFLPWRKPERPTKRIGDYQFLYGNPKGSWSLYSFDPFSRTFGCLSSSDADKTSDELALRLRSVLDAGPANSSPEVDPLLARAAREHGMEFAVAGVSGMAIPMEPAWLELTVLDPGLIAEFMASCLQNQLARIEAQYDLGIRLINGGGDFAFNSGPIYSPRFFGEVMAPLWKRTFDRCRELGVYYLMRSDGNLWPVADDLFGWARPHGYYEVDYGAGMRFAELRARFPDLTLVGNVDSDMLLKGTARQVRERAMECIDAAKPGVIVASANSILHGTPPENVMAMLDAAKS